MASKKYTLIAGLLSLVQVATYAQTPNDAQSYALDSSKVSVKGMPQYNEFKNNQYPYPAKPNSQWELGVGLGTSMIIGDVSPKLGYGMSVSGRKALGHVLSVRASYGWGITSGLDYRTRVASSIPASDGNPWAAYGNNPIVANYKTTAHQGSLDLIISTNAASHYRGNPKWDLYGLVGYSVNAFDVDVNARNGNALYDFSRVNYGGSRSDIRSALKDMMDDSYESNAPVTNGNRDNAGRIKDNWLLRHGVNFGAGFAYKISPKFNIGLEQKFTYAFSDDLDGVNAGKSNDIWSQTQVRLNFNIGNPAKHVEPLWWINPNNFIYNELNSPKHMKLPTPVLPDADGDGVTDQFDQEPNTPAGAPVDTHGVAKDTDGDGVPDYKDKELLTPQSCFPVDADGVGKCPEPPCCAELRDKLKEQPACAITGLPSVTFKSGSITISKTAQTTLASAAQQINANPNCRVDVIGYGASDKRAQQLSWDRVSAVIKYLVEKQGISEGRFNFKYGQQGDPNTVDLQGTTEQGQTTVPAPHPQYKKTK